MLLFMDGFSHYQLTDVTRKWTSKTDSWVTWAITNEGRSGNCVKRTSTSNNSGAGWFNKGPVVSQSGPWAVNTPSGICGFAVKCDIVNKISNGPHIVNSWDMDGTLITVNYGPWGAMVGCCLNSDGTLSIYRGGSGTPLATSIAVASNNSWFYFEIKWTIHPTTGSCIVRVNNVEVINYSGPFAPLPNFPGGPTPANLWSSVNVFGLLSVPNPPLLVSRFCDFYLSDTVAPNGNFLGDISIAYIIPDAVGANAMWTPSPVVPNWQNVKEVPPDDDVTYVQTLAIGNKDSYSFTPVTVNPLAIQHCILARRTAPGASTIQALTRQGGVDTLAVTQAVANETYAYNLFPFDTNPFTGIKWTQAEMNAAEFGTSKET